MDPQKALPRAVLTVAPTREEYVEASLIAAGRGGRLRCAPVWLLLAAALLFAGMSTVGTRSVLLGVLLLAAGALLVLWVLLIEPGRIRKRARAEWEIYQALLEPAQVRLYPDVVETYTQYLTLTDSYALMEECIETPLLVILRKDADRLLLLPRRCFSEQAQGEAALSSCARPSPANGG